MTFSLSKGYCVPSYVNFPLSLSNLLLGGSQLISTRKGIDQHKLLQLFHYMWCAGVEKKKVEFWAAFLPWASLSLLFLNNLYGWKTTCLGHCPLSKWEWKVTGLVGKSPRQSDCTFCEPWIVVITTYFIFTLNYLLSNNQQK